MTSAGKNSNVVTFRCGAFLNEIESDLQTVAPWSEEKTHLMYLLAQYMRHPKLAVRQRMRALDLIAKNSDMALAFAEAGYERTIHVSQLEQDSLEEVGANKITWTTCR